MILMIKDIDLSHDDTFASLALLDERLFPKWLFPSLRDRNIAANMTQTFS